MYTPSQEVADRLIEFHSQMKIPSYRRLARALGYDDAFAPSLAAIAKRRPGAISRRKEWTLRKRLGLLPPTRISDMRTEDLKRAIQGRYVIN